MKGRQVAAKDLPLLKQADVDCVVENGSQVIRFCCEWFAMFPVSEIEYIDIV